MTAIGFSADGRTLVTAGRDAHLIVWDARARSRDRELQTGGRWPAIQDLSDRRDGRTAYRAGRDGRVVAWDLAVAGASSDPSRRRHDRSGRRSLTLAFPRTARSRGQRPDRSLRQPLAGAFAGPAPPVGAARGRGVPGRGTGSPPSPTRRDASGSGTVPDAASARVPATGHGAAAPILTFSADGRWLPLSGGTDDILRVWDARRHNLMGDSLVFSGARDLSLSPDGHAARARRSTSTASPAASSF